MAVESRSARVAGWLVRPANLVCDLLGLRDENERATVRMLVNALIWTTLGVIVVVWVS